MKGELNMDYTVVINLVVDILKNALPIAIIFVLTERAVQFFLHLAFPKMGGR